MTDITQADIARLKEALEKARDTFKAFQDDNSHNAMQERLDSAFSDVGAYHAEILAVLSENERLREALGPFAQAAKVIDEHGKSIGDVWPDTAACLRAAFDWSVKQKPLSVTVGDLRRARAALGE